MAITRHTFVALSLFAALGLGCDDGGGAADASVTDGGSACGPDETESPNGVCVKNIPCGSDIPTFKIGLKADGESGNYSASIADATPSPPRQYFNAWSVDFLDKDGNPATDIAIDKARTWMPAHRHDGFVTPKWTEADDPGHFDVEKLNFWMIGPWEAQFTVTGPAGSDYVVFRVCVTK